MAEGLFAGLKVIDCASFIAAPAAATILSDFGADVIKIEPPGEGDLYRSLHTRPGSPTVNRDYAWILDNRNKRGLALDLKSERGHEVLCRLVEKADVFITNMPFPVRRKLKTNYKDLAHLNPRLIYASFTAYGETGPEAEKTGFDSTAYWARSGLMDMVRPDADAVPARSSPGMGDHPSAVALFGAIMTALWRREKTGRGGQVDSSLVANGLWSNSYFVQAKTDRRGISAAAEAHACAEPAQQRLSLQGRTLVHPVDGQRGAAIRAVHEGDRARAPDRRSTKCRWTGRTNSPELIEIYDRVFSEKTLDEWRKILDDAGITFGIVNTLDDLLDDEQARHAGVIVPFADGSGETISSPFNVDGETKRPPAAAPSIGQHTDEILREHGYSDAEIRKLRDTRAVG